MEMDVFSHKPWRKKTDCISLLSVSETCLNIHRHVVKSPFETLSTITTYMLKINKMFLNTDYSTYYYYYYWLEIRYVYKYKDWQPYRTSRGLAIFALHIFYAIILYTPLKCRHHNRVR